MTIAFSGGLFIDLQTQERRAMLESCSALLLKAWMSRAMACYGYGSNIILTQFRDPFCSQKNSCSSDAIFLVKKRCFGFLAKNSCFLSQWDIVTRGRLRSGCTMGSTSRSSFLSQGNHPGTPCVFGLVPGVMSWNPFNIVAVWPFEIA